MVLQWFWQFLWNLVWNFLGGKLWSFRISPLLKGKASEAISRLGLHATSPLDDTDGPKTPSALETTLNPAKSEGVKQPKKSSNLHL